MKQSRTSWHNRSRGFLDECARLIERRVQAGSIDGIFLCGSFATGEESVVLETDPPLLLSDVDLVVVGKPVAEIFRWSRRKAELGAACEELFPEIRFSGRVEVGIMTPQTLGDQPAKPGVYDMRSAGVVLSGAPSILDAIPAYRPADITTDEALALLENRVFPLLGARPEGAVIPCGFPYEFLYRVARVYTDIAVAACAIAGKYVSGYSARRDELAAQLAGGKACALREPVTPELFSKIDRWTTYKLDPSLETAGAGADREGAGDLWREAAEDLLAFWRSAAMRRRALAAGTGREISTEALAGWSANCREWRDHLRGWRPVLNALPVREHIASAVSLGPKMISASPMDVVRERGIVLLAELLAHGPDAPVRGSRCVFPGGGADWRTASARLCATWERLVFGRGGDGK